MGQKGQKCSLAVCQSPERQTWDLYVFTFLFLGWFTSYCYSFLFALENICVQYN